MAETLRGIKKIFGQEKDIEAGSLIKKFQNMNEIQAKELLSTYVDIILKCENCLKDNYNLENIPYLHKGEIPKSGTMQFEGRLLKYNFHGSGCTFELGVIELSYDIYIDRENYIVTSPWKFLQFIKSYLKQASEINEIQIANYLEKFSNEKIVKKVYPDYLVYEINLKR
jgi:hypothetical protein